MENMTLNSNSSAEDVVKQQSSELDESTWSNNDGGFVLIEEGTNRHYEILKPVVSYLIGMYLIAVGEKYLI